MVAPDVALVCGQVDAAFDALEEVDVTSLADDGLHGYVMELQRLTARLASLRWGPVGEWAARGVWADDGSRAAWARLGREAELQPATAKAEVRRAKKLRLMPVTAVAFAEGKLSTDQVDLLCTAYQCVSWPAAQSCHRRRWSRGCSMPTSSASCSAARPRSSTWEFGNGSSPARSAEH